MKVKPVRFGSNGERIYCAKEDATHLILNIPNNKHPIALPVILDGVKKIKSPCWSWNGSVDCPTLRPSILTTCMDFRCHSWITDGQAQFLSDCSHDLAGKTVDLLDVI